MTYFYATRSWSSQPQITEETIEAWKHLAEKKKLENSSVTKWILSNRIP